MNVALEPGWLNALAPEFEKEYFKNLTDFVRSEYQAGVIYPPAKQLFHAFTCCPFGEVKVVILGQDPYHGPGQAMGLCFSVNQGVPKPPSLVNIFKEVQSDTGVPIPPDGDLSRWAKQGVLLLNTVLSVRPGQANSHAGRGWETFTDAVIKAVSEQTENRVFILWGSPAQRKGAIIDPKKHLVLTSVHPSPLSAMRGFYGNKHFSRANAYLAAHAQQPVIW